MKYSLVLGGGGAKGSYELGVFKALKEMNIEITSIYGTSIGALNGALFIQGDIDRAQRLWSEITARDVMDIEENIESLLEVGGISSTLEFMMHVISKRGVDITPFKRLLEEVVDEESIRNSPIDFGIVTFSLDDFRPVKLCKSDIPKGKLIDYLIASSALPAFKKHTIEDKVFIDGAFCDNIPLSLAVNGDASNIIVVDILSPGIVERADTSDFNVINIKNPFELKGSVLNFNRENIIFNMNLGYIDGKKAFGYLRGYRYYFNVDGSIYDLTKKYISSLSSKDIINIYNYFGIEINPKEIGISKAILDTIMNTLKLYSGENIISKESILRASLEITADFLDIPKIKVYNIEDFIKEIIKSINEVLFNLNEEDYLDYIKNSVLLTDKKKMSKALLDSINKKSNLAFYAKSCRLEQTTLPFRKVVSRLYPRLSIAAVVLLFLDKEGYITLI
ncbi:patatin-like phospholipase family protein [Clostridium cylindrosporum]|uniref:Patatin-like phospholipase n=1 Tax=Clostridium cylindrosporum DSM 605 TaxID=1121307 RepID=A0A0J8G6P6_CLOCY|nr:patatin-like phospholipase family protein [Clostridium cylindrosporum]KMT23276.1 patatin-like phospholipase [Clostridium cylindrosporum DSM 605]